MVRRRSGPLGPRERWGGADTDVTSRDRVADRRVARGRRPRYLSSCLPLFPGDLADSIARIFGTARTRKERITREWSRLCASALGRVPATVFRETYVPSLRSATDALARGD